MRYLDEMNARFPVRKTKAQKEAFRQWVLSEMTALGYDPKVEENDKAKHRNLVVGDPEHAGAVITAHYDTPATILLPDLQIPRNFPVYALYQGAVILLMLLIALVAGVGLGLLTGSGDVLLLAFFGAFLALMALQLYGPANKNNVNDNTSGLAALLETMASIPAESRGKVAFILFDNGESGRRGSKAYARDHIEFQHTGLVVNLDSVGVGEHFLVMPSMLAKNMPQYEALERAFVGQTARQAHFFSSETTRCGSDHRSFKCGVGVMACRRTTGVGFFLGDLHTAHDTHADAGNIACLSGVLASFVKGL